MSDARASVTRHGQATAWLRLLAAVWLLAVLAMAAHQWQFWSAARLDTDVMALLPRDEHEPAVAAATQRLARSAEGRVVVMLGAAADGDARRAAQAWRLALPAALGWREQRVDEAAAAASVAFYRPWRDRLLTAGQREWLAAQPADVAAERALSALHQPGPGGRLTPWAADPLGLWPAWWAERGGETLARPEQGELVLASGDGAGRRHWVVLLYDTGRPAFALDGEARIADALATAEQAARAAVPALAVHRAGLPLHAEAAAVQASREVNSIGWGSLAAVMALVWLAFRRVRALALVALSLGIGVAAGVSATALVFGQVHLLTLVFGASLVGVAEDYGIHWFASRQAAPDEAPARLLHHLLPGLVLALVTSVLGYAVLAWAPFPGLRQMAVFSAAGLTAAFLTALCWFPLVDGRAPAMTGLSRRIAASLARWPRWQGRAAQIGALVALGLVLGTGLSRVQPNDDIRQLQSSPAALVADQREVGRLLGLPSPGQFYVVTAADEAGLLAREEALTARLAPLRASGVLAGWQALSDWVPSPDRQRADAALTARTETAVLQAVNSRLGESINRPAFAAEPLTLAQWRQGAAAAAGAHLWLGEVPQVDGGTAVASLVMLRGVEGTAALPRLAAAADGLPGVRWVDKPAEVSQLLGRYRASMTWLLLAGHALVLAALAWRFGHRAWRAWAPTAIASVAAVAVLGLLGMPLQLFNVLALLLLLGVGVDYGVFLLEHRGDGAAWLAVVLGAASTALSFGLLAVSSTPALRAFGLTLGIGLAAVSLLAPWLRAGHDTADATPSVLTAP